MARNAKRVARRKTRRTKVKTKVDRVREWREAILATLEDCEKRIKRIEEFLEPDLTTFHDKHKLAQLDIVDAEIAH